MTIVVLKVSLEQNTKFINDIREISHHSYKMSSLTNLFALCNNLIICLLYVTQQMI